MSDLLTRPERLSTAARAKIVTQSLDAPHQARFANQKGINPTTLSSWRGIARSGQLPVSAETRERLKEVMPVRTFVRRGKGAAPTRLSEEDAIALVTRSVRRNFNRDKALAEFDVSYSHLCILRGQARDGRLAVSDAVRAKLEKTSFTRRPRTAKADPVVQAAKGRVVSTTPKAATASKTPLLDKISGRSAKPKAPRKTRTMKITPAPQSQKTKAKVVAEQVTGTDPRVDASRPADAMIITSGKFRIEMPADTAADKIVAMINALAKL